MTTCHAVAVLYASEVDSSYISGEVLTLLGGKTRAS